MSLSIGIVGLPNVGKSTIFNSLTRQKVDAQNYPFCTIEPNVGCVKVPDNRLDVLAKISKSEKIINSTIEFIDIAGLVRGAHKGEGLGNKFLTNIRECNAICHILRHFNNPDIIHVEQKIDPKSDLEIINLELIMADLAQLDKKIDSIKNDHNEKELFALLSKIANDLKNNILVKDINLTEDERILIKEYNFLTAKPSLYIINIDEADINKSSSQILKETNLDLDPEKVILVCGKMEEELNQLPANEVKEYLNNLNVSQTGLEKMIIAGYALLNYISMLTSGQKETRSWQIIQGTKAPQAAGKIHTDFEKGFVRVEVISYEDFVKYNGWHGCKEKGVARMEGKEYEINDGDVVLFHFT